MPADSFRSCFAMMNRLRKSSVSSFDDGGVLARARALRFFRERSLAQQERSNTVVPSDSKQ